jgi:chitodextrinase
MGRQRVTERPGTGAKRRRPSNCFRFASGLLALCTVSLALAAAATYTYDNLGRLKSIAYDDGTTVVYSLDAAGNRTVVTTATDTALPSVPTGLAGTAVSPTQINLTWNASTDTGGSGLAGYRIFRGGTQIASVGSASYSDTSVLGGTTYTYTVASFDYAGNASAQSSSINKTTPDGTAPTVPGGLTATATSSTNVNLTWSASTDSGGSGLAGYKIYRGGTQILTSTTTTKSDTTVVGSTAYSYTVAAYDNAGNTSAQSSAVGVTTPDTIAPTVPTGLSATAPIGTLVNLSWTASTDTGGSGLAGYRVYRGGTQIGITGSTTYADSTVGPSTAYAYKVAAYDNATNASAQSSAANVTTPAGVPAVPTLSASTTSTTTNTFFTISWTASAGATSYQLYETNVDVTNIPTVVYTGALLSQQRSKGQGTWQYTVRACNGTGCSVDSNMVQVLVCPVGGCP